MAQLFTNNAATTLASGITNSATSLTVASGKGALFPNPTSPDFFLATLDDGINVEIVRVTARATDTFTIVRGQEGTSGTAFSTGAKVELRLTATGLASVGTSAHTLNGADFFTAAELADITSRTGALDVSSSLNAATQAAITAQKRLVLPTGLYSIGSPWLIFKFSAGAFSFFSVDIEGSKAAWNDDYLGLINNVTIKPTFNNKPAICIQQARAVNLKNITVIGLNAMTITAPAYAEMMTNSNWVVAGCRDSRYSPYAGIAIDPFGSSVPADGGYPGMSSYYVVSGAAGSSMVKLENVKVAKFVAGIVVSPNGTTLQGDILRFQDCSVQYCKTGLSICQAQARCAVWSGGDTSWCCYCFDGFLYGQQQGYAPAIDSCLCMGKFIFNVPNSFGTQTFRSIHAESFASIGYLGTAANPAEPIVFEGCKFLFTNFDGIFADWHCWSTSPVTFVGCTFTPPGYLPTPGYISPLRFYSDSQSCMRFDGCTFNGGGSTFTEFPLTVGTGVYPREYENAQFNQCSFEDFTRGPGRSILGTQQRHYQLATPDSQVVVSGSTYEFVADPDRGKMLRATETDLVRSLGSLALTLGTHGTATFTVADGTLVNPGDQIFTASTVNYEYVSGGTLGMYWNSIGIVTNVASNVVTVSGVPQAITNGTYLLYEVYTPRYHEPSTCTTNGTTSLTSVTPTGAWKNGQHIRGAGIPDGAYIVSGGGTATLVISKAATASASGVSIYDAILDNVWNQSNDGSGSGLDADLLDGQHASAFALLSGASFTSTVVVTTSAWEKQRLVTSGVSAIVRQGSDSNGLNFTTNALYSGGWSQDDATKKSFAYIQHLTNGRHEFRSSPAGSITWTTSLYFDESSATFAVPLSIISSLGGPNFYVGYATKASYTSLAIQSAAGYNRDVAWYAGANQRWVLRCNANAETGSDAGSDFALWAIGDGGSAIDAPFSITRAAGGAFTFNRPVILAASLGLQINSGAPVTTTNKLYQVSSTLYWNGAAVGGSSGITRNTHNNADYTITGTGDQFVSQIGTLSAARTVTLPAANGRTGQMLWIGDVSGTISQTNKITISRAGTDTIGATGSATTMELVSPGDAVLISDGSSKWILQKLAPQYYDWTSGTTWTSPPASVSFDVTCCGGGAGGGCGGTAGGSGGGAGEVVRREGSLPAGTSVTITIGATANGAASGTTAAQGTLGNTTSFGSFVAALGGSNGAGSNAGQNGPGGANANLVPSQYGTVGGGWSGVYSLSTQSDPCGWYGNSPGTHGTGGTAAQQGCAGGTGWLGSGGNGGNGGGTNAGANATANTGAGGGGGGSNGTTCGAGGTGASGRCRGVFWL